MFRAGLIIIIIIIIVGLFAASVFAQERKVTGKQFLAEQCAGFALELSNTIDKIRELEAENINLKAENAKLKESPKPVK